MESYGQYVTRKAKDSTAGAVTKYINFGVIKKGLAGVQITAVKDTGTVGGTIILERRIDTLPTAATAVWKQVGSQSYTLLNSASPQGDIFPVTLQDGVSYRLRVTTTGGKIFLYSAYLRW
jgi:hypothetical protein